MASSLLPARASAEPRLNHASALRPSSRVASRSSRSAPARSPWASSVAPRPTRGSDSVGMAEATARNTAAGVSKSGSGDTVAFSR